MTAANEQVVTLFELNGLTPEQIAEQMDSDVSAVKAILFQNSTTYRKAAKQDESLRFNDVEAEEMKEIILGIARYSDDEHLKLKAAIYVRDDKLGRHDVQAADPKMQNLNLHITQISATVQKALEAQARVMKQIPVVNAEAEVISK